MANRCPDCNKMCSIEQADPEVEGLDLEEGTVTGTIRLVLTSACCNTEILGADEDIEEEIDMGGIVHTCNQEEYTYEIEETDVRSTDKYEGKGRGQKHYYGGEIDYKIKCAERGCTGEMEGSIEVWVQASSFDEM